MMYTKKEKDDVFLKLRNVEDYNLIQSDVNLFELAIYFVKKYNLFHLVKMQFNNSRVYAEDEDLEQEVVMVVVELIQKYKVESNVYFYNYIKRFLPLMIYKDMPKDRKLKPLSLDWLSESGTDIEDKQQPVEVEEGCVDFQTYDFLTDNEQSVMDLRYNDSLTMPVIAERLKLTKQGVSWLHTNAIKKIKENKGVK